MAEQEKAKDKDAEAQAEEEVEVEPTLQDLQDNVAAAEARERRLNQQEADEAAAEHEKGALEGAHEEAEEARKALADRVERDARDEEKAKS